MTTCCIERDPITLGSEVRMRGLSDREPQIYELLGGLLPTFHDV